MKSYTKKELLDYVKKEMELKTIDNISVLSIIKIAEIFCIDLEDTKIEGVE